MKEILCFGDSNTYGLIPGTKNRYGRDTRWTGLIEQQLYGKGCRIIEEGLCGRTTVFEDELREGRKGAAFLPTLLESHAPVDRVVLCLERMTAMTLQCFCRGDRSWRGASGGADPQGR